MGVLAMNARRVTDSMFMAAAKALADSSPAARDPEDTLLPAVSRLREVAEVVGNAVAKQAQLDGVAEPRDGNTDDRQIAEAVRATMWHTRLPALSTRIKNQVWRINADSAPYLPSVGKCGKSLARLDPKAIPGLVYRNFPRKCHGDRSEAEDRGPRRGSARWGDCGATLCFRQQKQKVARLRSP